jgi:hypothetical protein
MNRKHNPLVSLAALATLAAILVLICTGCTTEAAKTEKTPDRFIIETATNNGTGHLDAFIITDTETGVQYLYLKSNNSGGLTVLQPAEEVEP